MKTTDIDKFGKLHKSKKILVKPCKFPFKVGNKEYKSCVDGKTGKWCATSVDKKSKKVLTWGYCPKDSKSTK